MHEPHASVKAAPVRALTLAWLLAAAVFAAVPRHAHASSLQAPRYTREQMEASLGDAAAWRFVYGTQDPASAPVLREQATRIAKGLFGADSTRVIADRALTEAEAARVSLVLLGGPRENAWTQKFAGALPVRFSAAGFTWQGREYTRKGDVIHLAYPNPLNARRFVLLTAANSPGALRGRMGMMFGGEDWRMIRDGELARSGRFAQSLAHPWSYDASLDRDRESERDRFMVALDARPSHALRVQGPVGLAAIPATQAAGDALLARLSAMGLGESVTAHGKAAPLVLTLYRTLEQKGVLTRDTRPEHLRDGNAHAALPAGRDASDLWSVVAARLQRLGASEDSRFLEPAGTWLCGRCEGEPLECAVSRLYFGAVLPTAADACTRSSTWRSPLIWVPARAVLARAVWECASPAARRGALLALLQRDPPGTLDSLGRVTGLNAGVIAKRYRQLADSLARAGQRALTARQPRPWRPADGFQRGVSLAHCVDLEGGYLSARCVATMRDLQASGADWITIMPFAYLPDTHTPDLYPSAAGGPDEENDESLCEVAANARALGIRVWLKPHLWTRGWAGALAFSTADWSRFYDRYHDWIIHMALLAQRERVDGLFVGHELVTATQHDPERWRALIGDVRRVYTGTLTYNANWDEVQHVTFWDALDLISVSFYHPLADKPTRDPGALRQGAAKALADLKPLVLRYGRPLLLAEAGYAPVAMAPVRPWEEGPGAADPETQRVCYRALVDALEPATWVAGAFWWKWFTSERGEGREAASFSPRGRPAEAVMRASLREWHGRPVRLPAK